MNVWKLDTPVYPGEQMRKQDFEEARNSKTV